MRLSPIFSARSDDRPLRPSWSGDLDLSRAIIRVENCLSVLHTTHKCRLNYSLSNRCSSFKPTKLFQITKIFQNVISKCRRKRLWHEDCELVSWLRRIRRSRELAAVRPPKGGSNGFWQDFTPALFSGKPRPHTRPGVGHAAPARRGNPETTYS